MATCDGDLEEIQHAIRDPSILGMLSTSSTSVDAVLVFVDQDGPVLCDLSSDKPMLLRMRFDGRWPPMDSELTDRVRHELEPVRWLWSRWASRQSFCCWRAGRGRSPSRGSPGTIVMW
ncbi:hypothetical protein ACFQYP_64495 [Nonomuraea antimicrobica]|uniref:hypothetical protein n=1 Tax=Nonomuraea antimicrobica TaxID=561173 RepID=UPI0031EF1DDB